MATMIRELQVGFRTHLISPTLPCMRCGRTTADETQVRYIAEDGEWHYEHGCDRCVKKLTALSA